MVVGLITTRHVFSEAPTMIRSFGWRVWVRCLKAALLAERVTFLEIVMTAA